MKQARQRRVELVRDVEVSKLVVDPEVQTSDRLERACHSFLVTILLPFRDK
jgi:hypothetical protein